MDAIATDYLVSELRRLRTAAGLTQEQFANRIHYSPQHVSAVERRERTALPDYLSAVDREFGTRLTFFYEKWVQGEPMPEWFRPLAEVERSATSLRYHEHAVVPGLLQTEEYARYVLSTGLLTPDQIDEYTRVRMTRQATVFGREVPPVVTFLIDEAALRRGKASIMKTQLDHLLSMSEQPRVYLHLIPLDVLHLGLAGPFVLARTERGEVVGFVDDQLSGRLVADPRSVDRLEQAWQAVSSVALPCDRSRDLIMKLVSEL